MKKIYYEKPECEILVVRFEGHLLTGSEQMRVSGTRDGYSGYYDLDNPNDE